ncbi:putative disease resistance protein RGA4 [Amaranthus tricolor]|uniref:putative disease resistance protein RGA4 n=1 Tax=Amaranthus tricolor TaxID=29722 RepID=UPI00258E8819|nr:putative disease resistance protein RGA4 [Amaranthus tricolor]
MAESFLMEAAMAVLTAVLSRAAEDVKFAWSSKFKNYLKVLDNNLKRIHMLLCGAANKRIYNPLLDDWLSKVKNVAYEADDLFDELVYEALKRKLMLNNQSRFTKNIRTFFTLHRNPVVLYIQRSQKVRYLMCCIEDVYRDAQVLGIKPVELAAGSSRGVPVLEDIQLQVQQELVNSRGLIGRDQDEANIVKMLCHPENADRDVNVIGIVGMAGLGKTALFKRAFDRDDVRKHFEKRIWVCVSHDFEVKGILDKMIKLLDDETSKKSSYQATVAKLEMELRGKRYLLVLDDVWDTILTVWESLGSVLLDIGGSNGTVVLATSHSSQVIAGMKINSEDQALTTRNRPLIYLLKGPTAVDSWSLFPKRLKHIIDVDRAERMVAKCGGVRLAINVLADLLRISVWKSGE